MKVPTNKISDIRNYYTKQLGHNYESAEAQYMVDSIISHFIEVPRFQLALEMDRRVSESLMLKIHFAIKQLLSNKPLQYVLGETDFHDIQLKLNKHVLIPRPETEELVSKVVEDLKEFDNPRILDLGTGSGAIAISLAKVYKSKVWALDVSLEALNIAKENAQINQVDIHFIQANLLEESASDLIPNRLDLVVSNPPYVRNQERKLMQANVLDYEPGLALFVDDDDALIFYERICQLAKLKLSSKGILWFEINEYLGDETKSLVLQYFQNVDLMKDYKGNFRFIRASIIL